jgi:hypothetical protein
VFTDDDDTLIGLTDRSGVAAALLVQTPGMGLDSAVAVDDAAKYITPTEGALV